MKKIAATLLTLCFLASASMVQAGTKIADENMVAAAKTSAQVKRLLEEGC